MEPHLCRPDIEGGGNKNLGEYHRYGSKGRLTPNSANGGPNMPFLPKAMSMATPATTGGNDNGQLNEAVQCPEENRRVLCKQVSKWRPTKRITAILIALVASESFKAVNATSLDRLDQKPVLSGGANKQRQHGNPINTSK